jgi:hypothetical protein
MCWSKTGKVLRTTEPFPIPFVARFLFMTVTPVKNADGLTHNGIHPIHDISNCITPNITPMEAQIPRIT